MITKLLRLWMTPYCHNTICQWHGSICSGATRYYGHSQLPKTTKFPGYAGIRTLRFTTPWYTSQLPDSCDWPTLKSDRDM